MFSECILMPYEFKIILSIFGLSNKIKKKIYLMYFSVIYFFRLNSKKLFFVTKFDWLLINSE
jgi:hypothetical protein